MKTELTSDQVFSFVFREAKPSRQLAICSAAILVCAIVIAALEPQASQDLTFLWAVFHWVTHLAGGLVIRVVSYFAILRAGVSNRWSIAFAVGVMPFGVALLSLGIDTLIAFLTGVSATLPDGYLQELRHVALPVLSLTSIFLLALFNAIKLAAAHQADLIKRFLKKPALRNIFVELPTTLGDDVICLSANDHYIHLRTALGSVMLNRRFSDCVDLLSEFDGLQVHRSHWVALKHIVNVKPKGSSYVCILEDRSEIPVSRRKYGDLKLDLLNHAKQR